MSPHPDTIAHPTTFVNRLVPFAHVTDVDSSISFYALLGFEVQSVLRNPQGRAFWAMLKSGGAEIMFAKASGSIDAGQQAVLFYMYTDDVASLRTHLLASGLADGGAYLGQAGPNNGRLAVFAVSRPHHMPDGEIRVHDPDGYCILVGQLG